MSSFSVCHRFARGRFAPRAVLAVVSVSALAACGLTDPSSPSAAGSSKDSAAQLVLADAQEPGGYNPVRGYSELGSSPLYDGLMRLDPTSSGLPTLVPALAERTPVPAQNFTVWKVKLRDGVRFHDGTNFDAADVVATYNAILDPASASEIASSLDMIERVSGSGSEVTFTLKYPYADFATRLLIGIAPSQHLTAGPAESSSLNTSPVGTGPYRLTQLNAEQATFEANPQYWRGAPQVQKLTTVYLPDDATRAQRMAAGEFDGTVLPPTLAAPLADKKGLQLDAAPSADWRAVSLPREVPFTKDPSVRRALNLAVDRDAMVQTILAGHGRPASTPVTPVYGAAFVKSATFEHDPEQAGRLLDTAGWRAGDDGMRSKAGVRAGFSVAYPATDTLRRDLATAFAADMRKLGVEVKLEALSFDRMEPRIGQLGVLLGGGDKPYSLDTQVYGALHTNVPGSSPWDNPGNHGTPTLDAALEKARRTADEDERTAAYRTVQNEYMTDPSYVFLVTVEHTYVSATSDWQRPSLVLEPHAHGVAWGPWWDLASWRR